MTDQLTTTSPLVSEFRHKIRTYEINQHKQATVATLINQMNEAALENVIDLKVSVWDLEPYHISWVLMRKYTHINRLPTLGETIKIVTYPAGFERVFTFRDYKIFSESDELLAESSSTWLLMDTQTREMAKIPPFILDFQAKMPPREFCLARPAFRLPKLQQVDNEVLYTVRWHQLDFNQHLNNLFYVQWMMEALPDNVLLDYEMTHFEIQYRMEARWKDLVVSQIQQLDKITYLHKLIRKSDGKELAMAKTSWQTRG